MILYLNLLLTKYINHLQRMPFCIQIMFYKMNMYYNQYMKHHQQGRFTFSMCWIIEIRTYRIPTQFLLRIPRTRLIFMIQFTCFLCCICRTLTNWNTSSNTIRCTFIISFITLIMSQIICISTGVKFLTYCFSVINCNNSLHTCSIITSNTTTICICFRTLSNRNTFSTISSTQRGNLLTLLISIPLNTLTRIIFITFSLRLLIRNLINYPQTRSIQSYYASINYLSIFTILDFYTL
ncbi:unnamed protein product [Paramecium sonneborni]|uniref:Uncharacterized protein n=1 Tax=Paramecium sonneborni TaxID=65129 RepID=A0A8S1RHK9_9CILI|nr:unnamed protein product [Paramecium sonneborni]